MLHFTLLCCLAILAAASRPRECSISRIGDWRYRRPVNPCGRGSVCVISNFGVRSSGVCKSISFRTIAKCRVKFCSQNGRTAVCRIGPQVANCGAWAHRADGGRKPNCRQYCPRYCMKNSPNAPRDNNGKRYCNLCALRAASCRSGFATFGPIRTAPVPFPPPSGTNRCSTTPSMLVGAPPPGPSCPAGQNCVISDFGLLAADRPNSGMCKVVQQPVQSCTASLCTPTAKSTVCKTTDTNDVTTCGVWQKRPNGNKIEKCSTMGSRLGPKLCPQGLTCVIKNFGFPAVDRPNSGTCQTVNKPVASCTFDLCTGSGAAKVCKAPETKDVTTCGAWATRSDGNAKPNCVKGCPRNCLIKLPNAPIDNTGKKYCNSCVLRVASCKSNFAFYGPVNVAPLPGPPRPVSGSCSTTPSMLVGAPPPGPSCPAGQTCVISDFGLLAADRPNSGMCKVVQQPVQSCTASLCTPTAKSTVCKTTDTNDVTTCGVWQKRPNGNKVEKCSTKGSLLGPKLCPQGLTCVIKDFGFPAADGPNSGTCQTVNKPVTTCTFDLCTASGAAKLCKTPETNDTTTCGAWATRSDGNAKPNCVKGCPRNCLINLPNAPVDNTGKKYCNSCVLRVASCESNFAFYGPVNADKLPDPPQSGRDKCSTSRSMVSGAGGSGPFCATGKTCVISNFGNPAADVRNAGSCKRVAKPVPVCAYNFCTNSGESAVCETDETKDVTTCGAWATRSDGRTGPSCNVNCPENCLVTGRPVDNGGKSYCNECMLRAASCESNFARYGPVARRSPPGDKIVPQCALEVCAATGASTRCRVKGGDTVNSCGEWAKGGSKPDCRIVCTQECMIQNKPRDSEGNEYCNVCGLISASCRTGFRLFGPVKDNRLGIRR